MGRGAARQGGVGRQDGWLALQAEGRCIHGEGGFRLVAVLRRRLVDWQQPTPDSKEISA